MTALRREAMDLIENIPDAELGSLIEYIKKNRHSSDEYERNKVNTPFLEVIRSGRLCKRTGLNVEEYMKELRENDRM